MFKDRKDAGEQLANRLLKEYKNKQNTIVIGLPRGGVVVAFEIAKKLQLPLDIISPRKISMPGNPETAIGAVTLDGSTVFNHQFIAEMNISQEYINQEVVKEKKEAERRTLIYRANRNPLNLKEKIVILVDDGVATGSTMSVAVQSIRAQGARKIIIALPIAPQEFLKKIASKVDKIICLEIPEYFFAVGQAYKHFEQIEDNEVVQMMGQFKTQVVYFSTQTKKPLR